jgi:hypothetical protein
MALQYHFLAQIPLAPMIIRWSIEVLSVYALDRLPALCISLVTDPRQTFNIDLNTCPSCARSISADR